MASEVETQITLPAVENEIQVRFSDTDAMGHISSGSYAAFAEVGTLDDIPQLESPLSRSMSADAVRGVIQKMPVQAALVVPLVPLPEFAPHE